MARALEGRSDGPAPGDDAGTPNAADPRFPIDELRRFAVSVLGHLGSSPDEADLVATSLVDADARGLASHGLARLPLYVEAVEAGGIAPDAPMTWVRALGATATLDAAFGFGHTAMALALDKAVELVSAHGCAIIGVRRSTHFGIGARWVEQLAADGLVGIVASNSGPSMAPFGGSERLLGTNPIAIGAPDDRGHPFVLDMATSAGAFGSVVMAAENHSAIPDTWAFDADGRPTTDPQAALDGALRPFGGHKGSGLAIAIEVLAGVLPGAMLSYEIVDMWTDPAARMGTGHVLVAIDPAAFAEPGAFQRRLHELTQRIQASSPVAGHDAVWLPGERERQLATRARLEGVPLPAPTVAKLRQLAERRGVGTHPFRVAAGPTVN